MNYLILGVNGMAGHIIAQYLKERGHQVIGFAKQESKICETVIGDARDWDKVNNLLKKKSFDIVVNAIGILNKSVDNDMLQGIYINSMLPHLLADSLKNSSAKLIHISTDCVFNGDTGSYSENSKPDATSNYGKTKALGEVVDDKNLTIRTSIIGPELKQHGIGLFHWFMSQEERVTGYNSVLWTGTTTLELAKAIECAAQSNISGLYHLVNNQKISKYELLLLFQKYCRRQKIKISKDDGVICDKTLINTRNDFDFKIVSYEQMIGDMASWIAAHNELYETK